jgi:hypothetical protein
MIQKFEAKRELQKIEQSFAKVVSLTSSTHPSPAPSDDLRLQVPAGNPALISLDLPLAAIISIVRRRNILTCTQTKKQQEQKLEQLYSIRLIRRDPKAMNSRHAKGFKVVRTHAYLQLLLIIFMQDYEPCYVE